MIKREGYLNKLRKLKDNDFIKVITGVRRSGKTYVMQMFKNELLDEGIDEAQIIFITFESMKFRKLLDSEKLYDYVSSKIISDKKMYLFFDEIQLVEKWEEAINSFRVDFLCDIYVTGSNASLLSGELATLLAGRMLEIPVFPLSFSEYLEFKNVPKDADKYPLFLDYVTEGGFPAVVLTEDDEVKDIILQGIFDSIILRDVTSRANVRNDASLLRITEYLLSEVGNPISAKKIANLLKDEKQQGANHVSVARYMELLEEAFIFYKSERYDIRGKEYLRTQGKYYVVDTGLRNSRLNKNFQDNLGHQIENAVFVELLRRGYKVDVGSYEGKEIDFVAKKSNVLEYFQVALELPKNSNREVENLKYLPNNYKKTVLTMNQMDVGQIDGIEIKFLLDWLVEG